MAVRLRPRNAEELAADADFADCVELQPEVLSIVLFSVSVGRNTQCRCQCLTFEVTVIKIHLVNLFCVLLKLGCGPVLTFVLFVAQLKRLKLRKNNWDSDTYEFDEVLTEFASQKRVYEVVAKPVVEVCCFF